MSDCTPTVIIEAKKKIFASTCKRQNAILNTVFVAGLILFVGAESVR